MSDQTPQASSQQTLVIALVAVAVLLASIVGLLVFQQSKSASTSLPVAADTAAQGTAPINPNATQNPPAGTTGGGAINAKTATKVPSGVTPEQFVKAYNEAVIAGKYDQAYAMLPVDKQQSYGSAASYASQVKQYGISGYKMGKPVASGDTVSIVAEQDTAAMNITYTWNFKKVGKTWYVESRTMGGTVQ